MQRLLTFTTFCLCLLNAMAADAMPRTRPVKVNLPDLSGENMAVPGYFAVDDAQARIGYSARNARWEAALQEYLNSDRSFEANYGMLITDRLGAGTAVSIQDGRSEVLLNAVFAPRRDTRFRISSAQMRASSAYAGLHGATDAPVQTNYLIDIEKYMAKSSLRPSVRIATYNIENNGSVGGSGMAASSGGLTEIDGGDPVGFGRRNGYVLDLRLRPTDDSRIQLRRERSEATYHFDQGFRSDEHASTTSMQFSHSLGGCQRLRGGYQVGSDSARLDVGIEASNWKFQVGHAMADDGSREASVSLGYTVPLNGKPSTHLCGREMPAHRFAPIVDMTVQRPEQFPHDPLIRTQPDLPTATP